ncbi:flippase [Methanobacterium sp. SMA-27]|uniref:flippase n=1 Tax=Methanobacterium sp. SMA-27 TaxID=1495336 RepID=UPI00064E7C49|nr:flippase [Methanobacterium sp. SMA-27]
MNPMQRFVKNIGSLFTSQILSYLISLIYTIYLVRYLGVENYGILAFALALTSVIGIFADFGLNILMTRELSKEKSLTNKYLNNIFTIKLLQISILLVFVIVIVKILGYPTQTAYILYLMMIFLIFTTFSNFFASIFQAYERLEYQSIASVLNNILMLIGIFILINYNYGIISFTILYALVGGLILIYYLFILTKRFELPIPKIKIDWDFWKPTIKTAAQFGLMGVFVTIYIWIDSVMLFFMQGDQAVGLYNAAYRIVLLLLFIPTVINAAIFPVMSKLYGSSKDSLKLIVEKYFKYMILIGVPLGVAITLLSNQIIILIFGQAFLASSPALQILVWATVFTFGNAAFVQLFQSTNKQLLLTKITFMGMIINITLNFILIPKFSYIAASFNTLITEFTILALVLIMALRTGYITQRKKLLNETIKIVISSVIMGLFILIFKDLNLLILILISAFLYVFVLFILKGIDKEDIEVIRNIQK